MTDKEPNKEFDDFINSGECANGMTKILMLLDVLYPGDRRKQGVALAAAKMFFDETYRKKPN